MNAKASSRPSASTTMPARALTPVRVPVLARTTPAPGARRAVVEPVRERAGEAADRQAGEHRRAARGGSTRRPWRAAVARVCGGIRSARARPLPSYSRTPATGTPRPAATADVLRPPPRRSCPAGGRRCAPSRASTSAWSLSLVGQHVARPAARIGRATARRRAAVAPAAAPHPARRPGDGDPLPGAAPCANGPRPRPATGRRRAGRPGRSAAVVASAERGDRADLARRRCRSGSHRGLTVGPVNSESSKPIETRCVPASLQRAAVCGGQVAEAGVAVDRGRRAGAGSEPDVAAADQDDLVGRRAGDDRGRQPARPGRAPCSAATAVSELGRRRRASAARCRAAQ